MLCAMTNTSTIAAGWYPAPQEPGLQRYWDGTGWGDERRPATPIEQGSVASLVLGIIGVLTAWILIGFVFGLIAAILGDRTAPNSSISKAGRVLGVVAILLAVAFAVLRGLTSMN